jgi:hypothetical protein
MKLSLRTATEQPAFRAPESDASSASEQARMQDFVKTKRSDLRNGLTRRQRTFVLEKLVGLNDKDAAPSAGYSLSVAEGNGESSSSSTALCGSAPYLSLPRSR